MEPALADSSAAEMLLPVVTVKAGAERERATVTKTDTTLVEAPQSISVNGREEVEAKGMRDLLDTLNYTPGFHAHLGA